MYRQENQENIIRMVEKRLRRYYGDDIVKFDEISSLSQVG